MYENTPQYCVMFYGRISNISRRICPLMSEKLAHWSVQCVQGSALLSQQGNSVQTKITKGISF